MPRGSALTSQQIRGGISYNRHRHVHWITVLRAALKLPPGGMVDDMFIRAVADWQEANLGPGRGDGKVSVETEASLNIQHPKAAFAVDRAIAAHHAGFVLFDSWGNDVRDNDGDGSVDDAREDAIDGTHLHRRFSSFSVVAGSYSGLGWNLDRVLTVPTSRTMYGTFHYKVCADVISSVFHDAGVMPLTRRTSAILDHVSLKGYVWRRSDSYPKEYVPGDFICTLGHGGGHSGIVVERSRTDQVPIVIELPGPSTSIDLQEYDPTRTSDIRRGRWTKAGVRDLRLHYLGRLLYSKCPP